MTKRTLLSCSKKIIVFSKIQKKSFQTSCHSKPFLISAQNFFEAGDRTKTRLTNLRVISFEVIQIQVQNLDQEVEIGKSESI
jgi:hypothetical protein